MHRWTLVTSSFAHIDPGHILFNGLNLWLFGFSAAAAIGSWGFLKLYLGGVKKSHPYSSSC